MSRANFVQVQLAAAATDIQTTLSVKAPVGGFVLPPADGGRLVLTDSPGRPLAFEVISYTSRSGSGPYTLNGVTRGLEGTVGLAWGIDTFAMQSLTAGELEEIIAGREPAIAVGTTAQYRRGDKTWQDLAAAVRAAVMTGLSTASATAVSATDSLLAAIGKLQAQITGLSTSKLDASANAVSATKLQTARTVTLSGDVTGSTTFDGTANVTISASFKDSGVASGTYTKVTVDQKGNVTAGSALLASDVPTLNQDTTGNAGTATKLQTSRTINGVPFDGTANITVADGTKEPAFAAGTTAQYRRGDKTWQDFATAVRASVMTGLSTVTATAVSATDTLLAAIGKLQAQITGLDTSKLNATANAVSASKLATARSIALAGDVTGSATFDGSANVSITATVADDSHNHIIGNVDGLQAALDGKLPLAGGTATGTINAPTFNATSTANGGFQGIDADTALLPSFTWSGDLDTGMWRSGVDSIGFTCGGVNRITINTTGISGNGSQLTALNASNISTGTIAAARVPTLNQSTTGNAATATKLATARTISLTGDVTGSATFDGSANVTITATVADDSHAHVIGNVDGLQAALDGKADDADIDFIIIYPNGGSAASPANVSINSRYVLPNPFPGHNVVCVAEINRGGSWGAAGWFRISNTINGGVRAEQIVGEGVDSIVVQTAQSYVYNASVSTGSPFGDGIGGYNALCRVKVWKIKGAIA